MPLVTKLKCQFVAQPCFKGNNTCSQLLEGDVKQLVREYGHTEESAREVALHNRKLLAPYCIWGEDYHYFVPDFNKPRNKCRCGKEAFWWDGEKSMCHACLVKQEDYKRGYAYDSLGSRIVSLKEKYGGEK